MSKMEEFNRTDGIKERKSVKKRREIKQRKILK